MTSDVLPNDPAVLDEARAKVAAGDTRGAIAGLAPYVDRHPGDVAAGRLLGDLYFRVPDYAKAERTWKALLLIDAGDKETHSRLGALYAAEDRIDEAIEQFKASLPSRQASAGLVMLHKRTGDLAEYMNQLQYDAEARPLDAALWEQLGQARQALHRYAAALDAFNHLVAIRPASCGARVDVANALVDLDNIDAATDHLRTCLAKEPNYYPAVVNLGEAYVRKHDYATARTYLDRALTLRAEGVEALVDIGYIYERQGDWKTAVSYYNRAIRSDPLRPEAYIDLGVNYTERRYFPLAEAAYIKGLSVAQDDGRLHYLLAVAYNEQGKIALARDQYRFAIASDEPVVARAAEHELALLPAK
ncbi:MAG TPA: tetratricopeptide repeat protein [Candidatus Elarobacter sp.]|nr:tetratricopeptide repeat protein [Candidatus Elarobacter sp.]